MTREYGVDIRDSNPGGFQAATVDTAEKIRQGWWRRDRFTVSRREVRVQGRQIRSGELAEMAVERRARVRLLEVKVWVDRRGP